MYRFAIVVPAHNEESRIAHCLNYLLNQFPDTEIIVSEDGSTDDTVEVAKKFPVTVLHSKERLGKIAGIKRGISVVSEPYIVIADVDTLVSPSTYVMAVGLLDAGFDLVAGKRVFRTESFTRRFLGKAFHELVYLMFGLEWDTQCGFKAIRTPLAQKIYRNIKNGGFTYDVSLFLEAEHLKAKIVELPIMAIHYGDSKVTKRDITTMLRDLLRIWWARR
jgi:glycosyltransferase involved in cell wall biosynthesis